jgi:type I restriction enzyme, S subunit
VSTFAAIEGARARTHHTWEVVPLKRLAALREDPDIKGTASLLSLKNTGALVPRGGDVQPPSDEHRLRYWLTDAGDLVVNPMWLAGGAIGVSTVSGAVSPDYRVYSLSARVEPRFIHHLFRSAPYHDQYRLLMRAETTFDRRVTKEDFAELPVLLPPLDKQRTIARLLDAKTARIDGLIDKKRRMISLLDARWAASVRNRLSALGGVMPLKRTWRVIDCKHRTPIYVEDGYPVTSPGDISAGRIDLSACHRFVEDDDFADLTEGRKPKRGDIIYSRNASAGIAAYVDTDEAFCMGQDVCLITSSNQDQRYLMYVLNSLGVDQLLPIKVGSTITRINVDQIGELEIPTPPAEVQRNVADALDLERERLDTLVARIRRQMDLLSEHRQALIIAAVTGQLTAAQAAA